MGGGSWRNMWQWWWIVGSVLCMWEAQHVDGFGLSMSSMRRALGSSANVHRWLRRPRIAMRAGASMSVPSNHSAESVLGSRIVVHGRDDEGDAALARYKAQRALQRDDIDSDPSISLMESDIDYLEESLDQERQRVNDLEAKAAGEFDAKAKRQWLIEQAREKSRANFRRFLPILIRQSLLKKKSANATTSSSSYRPFNIQVDEFDDQSGTAFPDDEDDTHDRMSWFDPADIGVLPIRERDFTHRYIAVGVFCEAERRMRDNQRPVLSRDEDTGDEIEDTLEMDGDEQTLLLREMLWDYHLHWMRRSQLCLYLSPTRAQTCDSGRCNVFDAQTVLRSDRLAPVAQLVFLEANRTEDVQRYLAREPLAREGLIEWKLMKITESENPDLIDIPRMPFVFLHFESPTQSSRPERSYDSPSAETPSQDITSLVADSEREMTRIALSADDALRYDRRSRVFSFASLHSLPPATHSSSSVPQILTVSNDSEPSGQASPAIGNVVLFNARTHADALRFVAQDPMGKHAHADDQLLLQSIRVSNSSLTILGAVNLIDVSGRARVTIPGEHGTLLDENMGDESPEELLMTTQYLFDDDNAREHFQENDRVMTMLKEDKILLEIPPEFYDQEDHTKELGDDFDAQHESVDNIEATSRVHFVLDKLEREESGEEEVDSVVPLYSLEDAKNDNDVKQ